jgi:hypothetical protein
MQEKFINIRILEKIYEILPIKGAISLIFVAILENTLRRVVSSLLVYVVVKKLWFSEI